MKTYITIGLSVLVIGLGVILATEEPSPSVTTNLTQASAPSGPPESITALDAAMPAAPRTPASAPQVSQTAVPDLVSEPARVGPPPNVILSVGVQEVIALFRGGVDATIIDSYVKSTSAGLQLNVNEILYLKSQGVPKEIVAAMIQRGAEQKANEGRAAKEALEQTKRESAPVVVAAPASRPVAPAATVVSTPPPYYFAPTIPVIVNAVSYSPPPTYPYGYAPYSPSVVFLAFGSAGNRGSRPPTASPVSPSQIGQGSFRFNEPFRFIGQRR